MSDNLLNREKWLKRNLAKLKKGSKILDAGAGELQYKKYCKHLKYVSQDLGQYTGENLNEGLQTGTWDNSKLNIVSDIINIPVKDQSFDAIMCIEVLEHIKEPSLAIKEFSRIIKKGGKLIITAPFCSLTHFAPYYYGNGYSKYWYEEILKKNGFTIIKLSTNGNYFDYLAQELDRLETIINKYSQINLIHRFLLKLTRAILRPILAIASENDSDSNELLCFGLHVLAEKNT